MKALLNKLINKKTPGPVPAQPFVDYSNFDEDQLLRNRSENWEVQ
jgi:hypothetical protein